MGFALQSAMHVKDTLDKFVFCNRHYWWKWGLLDEYWQLPHVCIQYTNTFRKTLSLFLFWVSPETINNVVFLFPHCVLFTLSNVNNTNLVTMNLSDWTTMNVMMNILLLQLFRLSSRNCYQVPITFWCQLSHHICIVPLHSDCSRDSICFPPMPGLHSK